MNMENTHDLSLSPWGPYTNLYAGISYIADAEKGTRFDLATTVGRYRCDLRVPDVRSSNTFHPWRAAPNLSFYEYRYEVAGKDVWCDVAFTDVEGDESVRLIRYTCGNDSDRPENYELSLVPSIQYFTYFWTTVPEVSMPTRVTLPEGGVWIDANRYDDIDVKTTDPKAQLPSDGLFLGEQRHDGYTNMGGLFGTFATFKGDRAVYSFALPNALEHAKVVIRYANRSDVPIILRAEGAFEGRFELAPTEDGFAFNTRSLTVGAVASGTQTVTLVVEEEGALALDGFAIVRATEDVSFYREGYNPKPTTYEWGERTLTLAYEKVDEHFGIAWDHPHYFYKEYPFSELVPVMEKKRNFSMHPYIWGGDDKGYYVEIAQCPVVVPPRERRTHYALVARGSKEDVARAYKKYAFSSYDYVKAFAKGEEKAFSFTAKKAGATYRLSQDIMAANVLTNVLFPC